MAGFNLLVVAGHLCYQSWCNAAVDQSRDTYFVQSAAKVLQHSSLPCNIVKKLFSCSPEFSILHSF